VTAVFVAASVLLSTIGVGAGAGGVQQPEATGPSFSQATAVAELRGRAHQPKIAVAGRSRVVRAVGHRLSGIASWFCRPGYSRCTRGFPASGMYAAAGPALRAALGNWRGRLVYVNGIATRIIDCNCGPNANLIDLYSSVFRRLAPLSAGRLAVTITW
jgi:hypothetical protein